MYQQNEEKHFSLCVTIYFSKFYIYIRVCVSLLQLMWSQRRRVLLSSLSSKPASWSQPEEAAALLLPEWPTDVRRKNKNTTRNIPVFPCSLRPELWQGFSILFSILFKSVQAFSFLDVSGCWQTDKLAQFSLQHWDKQRAVIWCVIDFNYSSGGSVSEIPVADVSDCHVCQKPTEDHLVRFELLLMPQLLCGAF